MVFADATDTTLFPLEQEIRRRYWCRNLGVANATRESDVSWLSLHGLCIGIESANNMSLFSLAHAVRCQMKRCTRSRFASFKDGVPQKSSAYALTRVGSKLHCRISRHR